MIRNVIVIGVLLFGIISPALAIDIPVFFLKYDGGVGNEEVEDEEMAPTSYRHSVSLRIKEVWSSLLVTNLTTVVTRKQYLDQTGSYTSVNLLPDLSWTLTDSVKWYTSFQPRWYLYDELDSNELPKNHTALRAKTQLTFKPMVGVKIIPLLQGAWDVYGNATKTRQTYAVGIGIDGRIGQFVLGADYRGAFRLALGAESEVTDRFNHTFGVDVTWDPND